MDLNKNSLEMLKYIMNASDYVEISDLCIAMKISDRAVRYRLDKIDEFLKSINLKMLERQHSKGVRLRCDDEELKKLSSYFKTYTPSNYYFSKEERQNFIKSELLQSDVPINSSYFMSVLNVSKTTVINDISQTKPFFEHYHLRLVTKPNVGIFIEGDESNKRRALSRVNSDMITVDELFDYLATGKVENKGNILQFENVFSNMDIDYLDKLIRMSERSLGGEFSDLAYGSLLSHIVIMIKRIQLGQNVLMIDAPLDKQEYREEIDVGKKMIESLEEHYKIEIPEEEVNYLVFHLLGAKFMKSENENLHLHESGLSQVIKEMISAMESIYSLEFSQEIYSNLLNGLILHLRPAINRIKFDLSIKNPIFDDIMNEYRELFENTKLVCKFLEKYLKKPIDDQEVSYIMLHFGAAIKNSVESEESIRVILVCGSGIGTANMLKSQINKYYQVNIVATTSARSLHSYDRNSYDMIISTIKIPNLSEEEYLRVNVILGGSDFELLDSKLLNRKSNKNDVHDKLSEILDVVEKYADIKEYEKLRVELSMLLSNCEVKCKSEELYRFSEVVSDKILICDEQLDFESVVKKACSLLENNQSVLREYADKIISLHHELGSYMAISNHIALLHANSPEYVLKTDFAILLMRNGVVMTHDERDPIKVFIVFSSFGGHEHYKILQELSERLSNKNFVDKMINAKSKYDIMSIL